MIYAVLVVGMLVCAVLSVRATRLLASALWLAGVSVFTAIILYLLGAVMMAVIELSLSVGLITILLVFAISMAGADSPDQPVLSRLNVPFVGAVLLLIIALTLPALTAQSSLPESSFAETFWTLREADVLAQIALIFAGVLGVLGLLAEPRGRSEAERQIAVQRQNDAGDAETVSPASMPDDEPDQLPEPELEAG